MLKKNARTLTETERKWWVGHLKKLVEKADEQGVTFVGAFLDGPTAIGDAVIQQRDQLNTARALAVVITQLDTK